MSSYTYTAYGLNFASSFPIPELIPHKNSSPDIIIRLGDVPKNLPFASDFGLVWQSAPGKLLVSVREIARYLIVENREIIIEPLPGISEEKVRVFLLGSVLGALLHARQMLVLHSSVIETKNGAILFMGHSGAGKSTLLGSFLKRGYAMLADDKAGIIVDENGVSKAMPGFPYARLTVQTVKELNYPVNGLKVNEGIGKYIVPIKNFCSVPIKVQAAYSLKVYNKSEIALESLPVMDAFQVLNRRTYRRRFMHRTEQLQSHFEIIGALSRQVRVSRVFRPDDASRIEELADRIEEDFLC